MKLNKYEMCIIGVTVAVFIFCAGYFTGRGSSSHVISVSASVPVEESGLVIDEADTVNLSEDQTSYADSEPSGKININTATAEELITLPGIGEVLAERIIEYRTEHSSFSSIEELMNVYGIGEVKFDSLKDYVTI